MISLLANAGANVDDPTSRLSTPCHYAAANANERVLVCLIALGANAFKRDEQGMSPLLIAARNPNHNVLAQLMAIKSDRVAVDQVGNVLLHFAATNPNVEVMRMVLAAHNERNLDCINRRGQTPLMLAAQNPNDAVFSMLRAQGADVSRHDRDGNSLAHYAARNKNANVLAMLLAADVRAAAPNAATVTPCHLAASNPNEQVMSLLIGANVNVNTMARNNETPLMLAAANPNEKVFAMLIEAGAAIDAVTTSRRTVCSYAAKNANPNVMQRAIDAGADFRSGDVGNATPFHLAAAEGNLEVMHVLLKAGIGDIRALARSTGGRTLVHYAALAADARALRFVLTQGVDYPATDGQGYLPCQMATPATFLALFAAGADFHSPNLAGSTPLQVSLQLGRLDLFGLLVAAGANVDVSNELVMRQQRRQSVLALVAVCDESPPQESPRAPLSPKMFEWAITFIQVRQFELLRARALEVCVGLQTLELCALQLCCILEHAFAPRESLVPFHKVWALVTAVKHFRRGNPQSSSSS